MPPAVKAQSLNHWTGRKVWGFLFFFFCKHILCPWASLVAQLVENPPAMQETWVRSLGWEDLLEKGTATYSRILAWRIP